MTNTEIIKLYESDLRTQTRTEYQPTTLNTYPREVKRILTYLGYLKAVKNGRKVEYIDGDNDFFKFQKVEISKVKTYFSEEKKYSASTWNANMSAFKSFLQYCRLNSIISDITKDDIDDMIMLQKVVNVNDRGSDAVPYEKYEVLKDIVKSMAVTSASTQRKKLALAIALTTGCRISELAKISTSDVNTEEGWIKVLGKGDKYRRVPLPKWVIEEINNTLKLYKRKKLGGKYLFMASKGKHMSVSGVRNIVDSFVADMKEQEVIDKCLDITPHSFRKLLFTYLIKNDMSYDEAMVISGHSNVNTLMIYVKNNANETVNKANSLLE